MRKYAWIVIGMIIGAGCLSPAYADVFVTFDISGTVSPGSSETGTTFSGNFLTIDGFLVSGELLFPGLPTLDLTGGGGSLGPPATETLDFASGGFAPINASLSVDVPTAFTFTGFNGGPILLPGDNVASFLGGETIYYTITGGNITPEVPEPSSFMVVLGLMALMVLVRRRRLAAGR